MGLGALFGFLNVVPICGVNFCLNVDPVAGLEDGCDVVTCMGCVVLGPVLIVDPATVAVAVADAPDTPDVRDVVAVGAVAVVDVVVVVVGVFFDPRVARLR